MKHHSSIRRTRFVSLSVSMAGGLALVALLAGCPGLVVIELEDITKDTTLAAGTYVARQDITVTDATLTVMPGVTIIFEQGHVMSVDSTGRLNAVGTEEAPIVFTGDELTRGYWGGLRFNNTNSTENRLEYVTVEYGGGYYEANVHLTGSSANPTRVAINHCTFRQSEEFGLQSVGTVTIEEFGNNALTENASGAASMRAEHLGYLEGTCTFTGNDVDIVDVPTGNVDADATWTGIDAPYFFGTDVAVLAALTIAPGAELVFDAGHTMSVDSTGSLSAIGTAEAPILFTGGETTPGYWGGVRFNNTNKAANALAYVTFEYGGGYHSANVYITGSSSNQSRVGIDNCVFRHSLQYGISTNDNITIESFSNNTMTGNTEGAALMDSNHVRFLDGSCTFSGNTNDVVHVDSGYVEDDATWPGIDVPYFISTDVHVNAPLVLQAGATLVFDAGYTMSVNSSGSLYAVGTATQPILFTGGEETAGYWGGVRINGSNSSGNELQYVTFEYGGGYHDANLYITGSAASPAQITVRNCTFADSAEWGIQLSGVFAVNLDIGTINTFLNNLSGNMFGF